MRRGAAGFRSEALGKIPRLAGDSANANRFAASAPAGHRVSKPRTASCARNHGPLFFGRKAPAMAPVLELIGQIGPSGCQRVDHRRTWHREGSCRTNATRRLSARSTKPMVTVNAGRFVGKGWFESELFGHVKGAFHGCARADRVGRFELADASQRCFLDEIANVPLNLQAKLFARFWKLEIWSGSAHRPPGGSMWRVLAATNADVNAEAAAGRFRQDLLFFRLNTIENPHPGAARTAVRTSISLAHPFFSTATRSGTAKIFSGFDNRRAQGHARTWRGQENVRELDHAVGARAGASLSPRACRPRRGYLGLRARRQPAERPSWRR